MPRWFLTLVAFVAFLLWAAGWVAEFVSRLYGKEFTAPAGAFPLLMLVLGGALTADHLAASGRRALKAASEAFGDDKEGEDEQHGRTGTV